jgi:hypothetical protein
MHGDARLMLNNPNDRRLVVDRRDRVIVGAPPMLVAGTDVRAYAERIRFAWETFWNVDFVPWAKHAGFGDLAGMPPEGIVIGDVIGGTPEEQAKAKVAIAYFDRVVNDFRTFRAYRDKIQGFDLLGPSPSQAWQELYVLGEQTLKKDRADFASVGGKLATPDPGALELVGGVEPKNEAASTIKTVAIAAAVAAVAIGVAVAVR